MRVLAGWQPWGPAARQYHFASRTLPATVYLEDADSDAELEAKAEYAPPPFKTYPDAPTVPLATGPPASDDWEHGDIVDALHSRRSVREFAPSPVGLDQLTALLQLGGGIAERRDDSLYGTVVFKTSPSAGARDPIEIYAIVRNVDSVDPGLYHFSPSTNALEKVGELPSHGMQAAALGGQAWLRDAPVVLVYSAVIARTQWRYTSGGLAGATVAARLQGLISPRALLVAMPAIGTGAVLVVQSAPATWAIGLAFSVLMMVMAVWDAFLAGRWLAVTDAAVRGRVLSSTGLVASVPAIGAPVASGVVIEDFGPQGCALILAGILAAVALVAFHSAGARANAPRHPPGE